MSFASRVLSHRSLKPRHRLGLLLVLVVLAWGSIWATAAILLNQEVDRWVNATKTNGIEFSFANRSTDGTPLTVHVHLQNFHVKLPRGGHEVHAGEAVLYLSLWDWKTVSTKLRDTIEGKIADLPFTANTMKIGFEKPAHPPINDMEPGFSAWIQTMGLTFKPEKDLPLGNRLDQLAFELRVMGVPPDFTNTKSIREWNNNSGVIEFDQLDVLWGPLALSAKGTIGLNSKLQPEGAFSGKVEGLDDTIDELVSAGTIKEGQEALLRSSISVLSRPSSIMEGSSPIVPVSLQDGGLYLGPVRVMTIPDIDWPRTDEPSSSPAQQPSPAAGATP